MYIGLLHLHNLMRYVIIILLVVTVVKSFIGWFSKKEYTPLDDKLSLFLFISSHIQLLVGLVLYFMSPIVEVALGNMKQAMSDTALRFWSVEHISSMILGIVIISLGRIMAKKANTSGSKYRRQAVYFTLGMVIIFSAIPWPWSVIARPWF